MLSTYEIGLILTTKTETKDLMVGVKKLVEKTGTKVQSEEVWGKKTLTFGIKKQLEGVYAFMIVTAEPNVIVQVANSLKSHEPVLRYLIIKAEEKKAAKNTKKEAVKEVKVEEVKKEEEKKETKKKTKSKK